jgi:hypothetical protein
VGKAIIYRRENGRNRSGWDFAMRDTREWSDIVFQVSEAIIVIELVVRSIGFNPAAGLGVAVWVLSFYDICPWKPSKGK